MDTPSSICDDHVLDVLGSITANDKLCTQGDSIDVYRPSVFRGAFRWWSGESRARNMAIVDLVLRSSMQTVLILQKTARRGDIVAPAEANRLRRTVDRLRKASVGLSNLIETYRDDLCTCAKLRTILATVEDFLHSLTDPPPLLQYVPLEE